MKDFIYDVKWVENKPNHEMYYMYRSMAKNESDKKTMAENDLRYNITIITPQMLGEEFPKTIGHEHALIPGLNITYPEMYGVLEGEAYYLAQKCENGKIIDIYAVKTKAGEKCIIPPDYGHVTINASGKNVIMADWSEKNFKSDYSLFKNNHGGGYYALKTPLENKLLFGGELTSAVCINWTKNKNYVDAPEIKIYEAQDFNWLFERFGINMQTSMYDLLKEPEKLDFLKNPQKHDWNK